MGRPLREISPTGIYHVMLRGVNKQRIFEYIEDYQGFLSILDKALHTDTLGHQIDSPNFDLYAYCLMDNHVHLLIGTRAVPISDVIQRIASSYARFFNYRYHRVGHFFQDRFRSEACLDDSYFYTLLRYIHLNPIEAGICQYPDQYQFSSFNELVFTQRCQAPLCNLSNISERIGSVNPSSIREWLILLNDDLHKKNYERGNLARQRINDEYKQLSQLVHDKSLDVALNPVTSSEKRTIDNPIPASNLSKITQWCQALLCNLHQAILAKADADTLDRLIEETLLSLTNTASISEFQRLDKKTMRNALAQVRDAGISIRHLSRISGISEGIIRYCKNPDNLILHNEV